MTTTRSISRRRIASPGSRYEASVPFCIARINEVRARHGRGVDGGVDPRRLVAEVVGWPKSEASV